MSSNERRTVPHRAAPIVVRFNVITQEFAAVGARARVGIPRGARKFLETIPLPQQGETVDRSERGIRFRTRHSLSVGESVEVFFTLPTELTGRAMEEVQCNARVVQVDEKRTRVAALESALPSSASSARPWRAIGIISRGSFRTILRGVARL
jgi:hypothetical protein